MSDERRRFVGVKSHSGVRWLYTGAPPMSAAAQFYLATIAVYTCVNVIASWALDIQFGVTGVLNFAFIVFQAIGAYPPAS